MLRKSLPVLCLLLALGCATRKPRVQASPPPAPNPYGTDSILARILSAHPASFDSLLRNRDQWKIRIIYTEIDRRADNTPVFTEHRFGSDEDGYFYPASTVKMPVAFLALQRLNELSLPGLDRNSTLITEAARPAQSRVYNDPSTPDGRPTVAQYIRKIFLVSDNDAFNRLYEFLGQEYINRTLQGMGYDSAQILHRLNISLPEEENRQTNPVRFYDSTGRLLLDQPAVRSDLAYQYRNTRLGRGFMSGGRQVDQPFDFSRKNRFRLEDLNAVLKSVLFPEAVPPRQRFRLTEDDYAFLYRYMSLRPGESASPVYDSSFNGAYSKLLLYGGKGDLDPRIRIFNKEGDAYGFLTDVAYVVDFTSGVEFLLSATIYCNSDGIFNDDRYDYETVGYPFLRDLGRAVLAYERERKRPRVPDLQKFKIDYGR